MSPYPDALAPSGEAEYLSPDLPDVDVPFSLPGVAKLYLAAVTVVTAIAAAPYYAHIGSQRHGWATFAALALCAGVAHMFPVRSPRNMMYHTSTIFVIGAALLLPPDLVILIPVAISIPEWLKERYPWPIQLFNLSNYTLNALSAWAVADLIEVHGASLLTNTDARFALAGVAASAAWVGTNHVLLGVILKTGREHSFRDSGLFTLESLSIDLVLAVLGVSLAAFWLWNPWLIFAALAPLVVVHRSLAVPQLQAEARVDSKTGLYNARYFASALNNEIARAARFGRPMSVIMADLDMLRDINNSFGHLAGDAVLCGVADVFQAQLRHYDVACRFGGEEFSIVLPETDPEQALEIAERIRRQIAESRFEVETTTDPIRATVSMGVASFPVDGRDANDLIHQADLAVYRAKLQGRNRVVAASSEHVLLDPVRTARLEAVREDVEVAPIARERREPPSDVVEERRHVPKPRSLHEPTFFALRGRLALLVATVSVAGIGLGIVGCFAGTSTDALGLLAVVGMVGAAQALTLELTDGSISVSAVGSLAGAALFDYRAALPLALTIALVDWSARRNLFHHVAFNVGTLTLSGMGAAAIFEDTRPLDSHGTYVIALVGLLAGGVYFLINMTLVSLSSAVEGHENPVSVFRERFAWLAPHYVVYGFIGAVIAIAYDEAGLSALLVFALPLLLMRKTQEAYVAHTQKSTQKLREASVTIQEQNVSLEQANRLLRERSTAAMESLAATVDARDAYTAGHSRRVRQLALAIGRELELSEVELALLDRAALFHDIGKIAVPDAVLMKPGSLTRAEWRLMKQHAEEGASIIERLGFLADAVPAIRHHHEHYDGSGYPRGLVGEEIPLGARIIHVADALDSMLTTRIYRPARPLDEALLEIRNCTETQFCPRCVAALERILPADSPVATVHELGAVQAVAAVGA